MIVDYDPGWPGQAAAAIAELRPVLAGVVTEIEHIGSTSVPGMAAKPTIDQLTDRARAEAGLAPVPVWEKGA
ncbi:GrpB family protein [Actinoplanes sp. NPDC048988]|uniref:GrpB family protein n=1 Tax=Actinoplanes sp. NPDC048988 TaxID=3363901 RepID=UPI00371EB57A